MKLWPIGKKAAREISATGNAGSAPAATPAPSAFERLVTRNCGRDEFVLLYFGALQERIPDCRLEMAGELEIRIINSEGKEATTFLNNAWIEYSRNAESRRDIADRYLRGAVSLHQPTPIATRESIVAMVKDAEYVASFKPETEAVVEHLIGDLWVVYALDLPDRMCTLRRPQLGNAGIDETAIRRLAIENLRRIMPSAECHGDGPWYFLTAGGDYVASLLLFDSLWDELADSVEGDIVAAVPARDTLLYTGSRSAEGLKAIREQAAHVIATGNYLITDTLILRKGGRWEVFNAN